MSAVTLVEPRRFRSQAPQRRTGLHTGGTAAVTATPQTRRSTPAPVNPGPSGSLDPSQQARGGAQDPAHPGAQVRTVDQGDAGAQAPTTPKGLSSPDRDGVAQSDRQFGSPPHDRVEVSGEGRAETGAVSSDRQDHLTAMQGALGDQGPGSEVVNLENPSAELERDCALVLAGLGESLPADLQLGTHASAVRTGPTTLSGSITRSLDLEGKGLPSLSSLQNRAAQAEAAYRGKLPPKVSQHLELAKAALHKAGLA